MGSQPGGGGTGNAGGGGGVGGGAPAPIKDQDSLHQLRLVVERLGLPSDDELSTIHNAQAVTYTIADFVDKNRDQLPADATTLAKSARFALIPLLFSRETPQPQGAPKKGGGLMGANKHMTGGGSGKTRSKTRKKHIPGS